MVIQSESPPKFNRLFLIIQIYSGITRGKVLNGELYTQGFTEVNLSIFVYRLFHEDFSPFFMS